MVVAYERLKDFGQVVVDIAFHSEDGGELTPHVDKRDGFSSGLRMALLKTGSPWMTAACTPRSSAS